MRFLFLLLFLVFSSCSGNRLWDGPEQPRDLGARSEKVMEQRAGVYDYIDSREGYGLEQRRVSERAPWELFAYGQDLAGGQIQNYEMLRGDEFLKLQNAKEALSSYQAAVKQPLSPAEKQALIFRIATAELKTEKWKESLATLSSYFRSERLSQDQVPPKFSLLFAFAFGAKGDVEQSLAWFSLARRQSAGKGGIASISGTGVAALARMLPNYQLDDLTMLWRDDSFISGYFARERARRAYPNVTPPGRYAGGAFWQDYRFAGQGDQRSPLQLAEGRVLVFLPLSGRHAALGKQVKSGIELALLARGGEKLQIDYIDTQGDTLEASSRMQEYLATGGADLILGPLLSEVALAVSEPARLEQVPMIVFSKRSSFPIGGSVFRLGATVASQVDSLLEVAVNRKGFSRFGLVYPETILGEHYAEVFRERLAELGGNLVYESSFPESDSSALVLVSKELETTKVDAIFLPSSLQIASNFWTNFSPMARTNIRLLGPANWYNPVAIKNSLSAIDGTMFVSPYFLESQRQVVRKFNEAFQNQYGLPPDFLAAQGFDAATLALAALERKGGGALEEALRLIDSYEGLTGNMSVQLDGEVSRIFPIVEVSAGALSEVSSEVESLEYTFRGNQRIEAEESVSNVAEGTTRRKGISSAARAQYGEGSAEGAFLRASAVDEEL